MTYSLAFAVVAPQIISLISYIVVWRFLQKLQADVERLEDAFSACRANLDQIAEASKRVEHDLNSRLNNLQQAKFSIDMGGKK